MPFAKSRLTIVPFVPSPPKFDQSRNMEVEIERDPTAVSVIVHLQTSKFWVNLLGILDYVSDTHNYGFELVRLYERAFIEADGDTLPWIAAGSSICDGHEYDNLLHGESLSINTNTSLRYHVHGIMSVKFMAMMLKFKETVTGLGILAFADPRVPAYIITNSPDPNADAGAADADADADADAE